MTQISNGEGMGSVRVKLNDTGIRKNEFAATRVPAATDNGTLGFEVGSRWVYNNISYTLTALSGAVAFGCYAAALVGHGYNLEAMWAWSASVVVMAVGWMVRE